MVVATSDCLFIQACHGLEPAHFKFATCSEVLEDYQFHHDVVMCGSFE